jgi:hypothetical protein|tara:strand:- start:229 stop:474 length:246 start_codon:yes stop_codon:yes gene_type:complete
MKKKLTIIYSASLILILLFPPVDGANEIYKFKVKVFDGFKDIFQLGFDGPILITINFPYMFAEILVATLIYLAFIFFVNKK